MYSLLLHPVLALLQYIHTSATSIIASSSCTSAIYTYICLLFYTQHIPKKLMFGVLYSAGAKRTLLSLLCAVFGLAVILVSSGIVPAFTEDIARPVNVRTAIHYLWYHLITYLDLS